MLLCLRAYFSGVGLSPDAMASHCCPMPRIDLTELQALLCPVASTAPVHVMHAARAKCRSFDPQPCWTALHHDPYLGHGQAMTCDLCLRSFRFGVCKGFIRIPASFLKMSDHWSRAIGVHIHPPSLALAGSRFAKLHAQTRLFCCGCSAFQLPECPSPSIWLSSTPAVMVETSMAVAVNMDMSPK